MKFIFVTLFYGALWFGIFSIQVSKEETIFTFLHKALKFSSEKIEHQKQKKDINTDQVIDALTGAFK